MSPHEPALMHDRILLVDDDAMICESLSGILTGSGYTVETAQSGHDALARLAMRPSDAVILDIQLPDISGIDLLHAIKRASPATEVIMLTGRPSLSSALDALNGTAFGYLEKPVEASWLLAALGRALEHKRLVDERGRRQGELTDFLESVAVALHWLGQDGRVVWANRAQLTLLGYEREEYVGRLFGEFLVEPEAAEDLLRRLDGGEPLHAYPARLRAKDGSIKHVLIDASGSSGSEPRILARCVSRDVTEQQRIEEVALALTGVGRELTETLDLAQATDRVATAVRRLFHVRRSALYRFDATSGELTCVAAAGDSGADRWIGQRLPMGHGLAGQAVAAGQLIASADVLAGTGGEPGDWLCRLLEREGLGSAVAVPLRDRGQTLGCLAIGDARGRAFTARELELLAAFADQAALAVRNALLFEDARTVRDFLRSIAESSADAIVTTDRRGRFTYVSPGTEAMFGYPASELLGRPAADYYRGGVDEARALTRRLATGALLRNYETAVRARDGRWVPVSTSMSLLRIDGKRAAGTLGVIKDMTAREEAEAARREIAELRAVAALAGGVAHEINNPLAVVVGQLELLGLDLTAGSRAAARVRQAMEAAQEVKEIVARMARITRVRKTTAAGLPPIVDIGRSSDRT
jgi:PAS domain S-box-containing protein